MAGEPARVGLADMANAERVEEAVERDAPARLDRGEQIARGSFAKTVPVRAAAGAPSPSRCSQGENVGGDLDATLRVEQLDLLVAEALDVEGVARGRNA